MVYFDQILHTHACQHCLTSGMRNSFFMDAALLSISQARRGKLVNLNYMVLFGSNFTYLLGVILDGLKIS